MRARWLVGIAGTLMLAVLAAAGPLASAAGTTPSSSIQMQGMAQVDQSQRIPRLLLSSDSVDGSGYHVDATLSPSAQVRQPGEDEREGRGSSGSQGRSDSREAGRGGTGLVGSYTLSRNGTVLSNGQAMGQLNRNGTGSISLSGDGGTALMRMDFAVDNSGAFDATLSGQIPQAMASPGAGSAAAATAPAIANAQPDAGDHVFWYLARAAGLSAYLMLFLNVVFGLAVHTKVMDRIYARWRSLDLHQFTTLLALGLLSIHALALLGDQYIGFSVPEILVPLLSPYRPVWTAIGVIGGYLLVLVAASSYLRKHISYGTWRSLHYISFGAYVLALAHGILAGTDTSQPWAEALYWSTGLIVVALMVWRFRRSHAPARQRAPVQQGMPARSERRLDSAPFS